MLVTYTTYKRLSLFLQTINTAAGEISIVDLFKKWWFQIIFDVLRSRRKLDGLVVLVSTGFVQQVRHVYVAQFGSARSSPILRLNFPPMYFFTTCETSNKYVKGLGQGIPAGEYSDHFVAGQLLVAISYRFQLYPYQLLLHYFFYSHQHFLYDT